MDPCMQRALMFVGAVIGAGFASGREVVSFFSSYGAYSWGMILLSVGTMVVLCALCLKRANRVNGCHWCVIYQSDSFAVRGLAEICILFLQVIMGGSMISAAGHIVALVLPIKHAYCLGAGVTIALAMAIGNTNLKPMAVLSGLLMFTFVAAIITMLVFDGNGTKTFSPMRTSEKSAGQGFLRAVAYAAMNLAISIGMICRCSECSCRSSYRSAVLFGLLMTALLFVSNYLYLQHPELQGATFPMVDLLACFGRTGHLISLFLMYLAILTTLSAGLYALRIVMEAHLAKSTAFCLTVLFPLAVSCIGFESIVDRWYAPAGLLCLLLVFGPLFFSGENGS